MLKLIATDMDGTLLNDNKEMPADTFAIIEQLHQRGITFAVASGRNHNSLFKLYDQIKDEIVVIASNGAIMFNQGKIIYANPLAKDVVFEIVETLAKTSNLYPKLSGLNAAYFFTDDPISQLPDYELKSHFPQYKIIANLDEIPADEQILQLSVHDPDGNTKINSYEKLKHLSNHCHLTISEDQWLDIVNLGVNKGVAIAKLQALINATPAQTMVFGDQMNDYEMMQQAYYSYAMTNATKAIKDIANFVAPTNEEAGVTKIIANFLAMTANFDA